MTAKVYSQLIASKLIKDEIKWRSKVILNIYLENKNFRIFGHLQINYVNQNPNSKLELGF